MFPFQIVVKTHSNQKNKVSHGHLGTAKEIAKLKIQECFSFTYLCVFFHIEGMYFIKIILRFISFTFHFFLIWKLKGGECHYPIL